MAEITLYTAQDSYDINIILEYTSTLISGNKYSLTLTAYAEDNDPNISTSKYHFYVNGSLVGSANFSQLGRTKIASKTLEVYGDYYGKPTSAINVKVTNNNVTPTVFYNGSVTSKIQLAAANPEYTLSLNVGTGATVSVTRTSSPLKGASTGTLYDGSTIYVNDVLTITPGTVAGYSATSITVNNSSFTGGTYTVGSNITVKASASLLSYTLSISAGSNASITVNRTNSPLGNASTGVLSNGSKIYYSDELKITFAVPTGYKLTTKTVNNSAFTSGSLHSVTGAVSVVATAELQTFVLSLTQATGTTIALNRTNSTIGNGSIGNLASGATLYHSDVIEVTVFVQEGYEVTSQTFNGTAFNSGYEYTVQENVTIVTLTKTMGLVFIDNGTTLEAYLIYIDNGTSWDQHIPYIDNGSGWDMCN